MTAKEKAMRKDKCSGLITSPNTSESSQDCPFLNQKLQEQAKEIIKHIEVNHRDYGCSIGGISMPEQVWERVKREIRKKYCVDGVKEK